MNKVNLLLFALLTCVSVEAQIANFESAKPNYSLRFPRDHGNHQNFQTEWWYLTGQGVSQGKELFQDLSDFGFQLTFFRRALTAETIAENIKFNHYLFAHAALTDVANSKFLTARRSARSDLGIAFSSEEVLNVSIADWKMSGDNNILDLYFAPDADTNVQLKGQMGVIVPQGHNGYSLKTAGDCCASIYYSIPRIKLKGEIVRHGEAKAIEVVAWLDHEFMTNALTKDQKGWDWFGISLKNNTDLMLFRMRSASAQDFWAGTIVKNGVATRLEAKEFSVDEVASWRSPLDSTLYPAGWKIKIPHEGIDLNMQPLIPNQEQFDPESKRQRYWEGAVQDVASQALGYVELTGYADQMGGQL